MAEELRINIYKITRGACRRLEGPCPHTVCRFNLTSEQMHLPVVRETCALEAADRGGMTLEEIASRLSLTRERVRQIELGALKKLWAKLGADEGERVAGEPAPAFRRAARVAA
jgi:hypothetical protein